jgi:general secretion pathway protein A
MYESHFGLSGPPFQLNPDPSFYFDSRGHSNALAYLKFGVHQGEGFIVVTGEIGAGKTTLVRALLENLNSDEVIAAQVLNTQLESGELLQSILSAFGVPLQGSSKAQLLASLEAFLTAVAAQGRRALLVVDEAQNLGPDAIEELRMLSNFQLGSHALLQSFLVGQPELRKQLESRAMEQLRQRVIASCHLGPLSKEETRAYVEHRLRHVGWADNPSFEDAAFDVVYGWTGGIPRKINLLCNRLLLAAFLGEQSRVDAALAEQTAQDLVRETGGSRAIAEWQPARPVTPARTQPPVAAPGPEGLPLLDVEADEPIAVEPAAELQFVPRAVARLEDLTHSLLCVADSPLSYLKFSVLAKAMRTDPTMPSLSILNPGHPGSVEADQLPTDLVAAVAGELHLGIDDSNPARRLAGIVMRCGEVLGRLRPCAVVVAGASDAALACALVARKCSVPLARLGAGQRRDMQASTCDFNAVLMDRMAEVLYTSMLKTHYTLYREGISAERMVCVGDLSSDGLHLAVSQQPPVSELLKVMGLSRDQLRRALRGFAVVTAQVDASDIHDQDVAKVARVARDLGKETLVVWIVSEPTSRAIQAGKANALLQRSGVVLVPRAGYSSQLGLVRGATCVIAGPGWGFVEEADCLDIPSIVLYPGGEVPTGPPGGVIAKIPCDSVACVRALHEILERGRPEDEIQDKGEGAAGERVLEHLRRWLIVQEPAASALRRDPRTASNA